MDERQIDGVERKQTWKEDISFVRDELIADCAGLIAAFGKFDSRLLRLFLGIENDKYRQGGRLENYEGGQIENIPSINEMIDELEVKVKDYKDVDDIWENLKEIM